MRTIDSTNKLVFHYGLLTTPLSLQELGERLNGSLKDFILFPRVEIEGQNSYLLIFWTDQILNSMPEDFTARLVAPDIYLAPCGFIVNNGMTRWGSNLGQYRYCNYDYSDFNIQEPYYLIAHTFEDGVYRYRIISGADSNDCVYRLCGADNRIKEGMVIDYVFIMKNPNEYNYFYKLDFKIKDSYVTRNDAFLFDVKGIFNPKVTNKSLNRINFFRILPDKTRAEFFVGYYKGFGLKVYLGFPEDKTKVEGGRIIYETERPRLSNEKIDRFVIPNDLELREKVIESLVCEGQGEGTYLSAILTKGDVIKNFVSRVDQAKREALKQDRLDLERRYYNLIKRRDELLDNKIVYAEKIKNFIPTPDIVIPKSENCQAIAELTLYITKKGDKYYFEREESNT